MNILLSFKDCPHKCVNGYYIDPYKHKRVQCEYCRDKRKEVAQEELTFDDGTTLESRLNLPGIIGGYGKFDFDAVVPKSVQKKLIETSVNDMSKILTQLFGDIGVGVIPDKSYLFYLGSQCFEMNFIAPYIKRAYLAGINVSPFITTHDIRIMKHEYNNNSKMRYVDFTYEDLLSCDLAVVVIIASADFDDLNCLLGTMQLRGYHNLPTLIITKLTPMGGALNRFIARDVEPSYSLVEYHTFDWKDKKVEDEFKDVSLNAKPVMTKDSFSNLFSTKNML